MYMENIICGNFYLRNKSYKQFLVKNKSEAVTKIVIFEFFFQLKFFCLLLYVSKNIIS